MLLVTASEHSTGQTELFQVTGTRCGVADLWYPVSEIRSFLKRNATEGYSPVGEAGIGLNGYLEYC